MKSPIYKKKCLILIFVKNLCKDFVVDGKVFHALKNINLDVEAQDIYGIMNHRLRLLKKEMMVLQ